MNSGTFVILSILCVAAMQANAQSQPAPGGQRVQEAQEVVDGEATPSTPPTLNIAGPDKEKRVCTREVITGSRIARKVCMTESERAEMRRATREALRDAESKPQHPYRDRGGT